MSNRLTAALPVIVALSAFTIVSPAYAGIKTHGLHQRPAHPANAPATWDSLVMRLWKARRYAWHWQHMAGQKGSSATYAVDRSWDPARMRHAIRSWYAAGRVARREALAPPPVVHVATSTAPAPAASPAPVVSTGSSGGSPPGWWISEALCVHSHEGAWSDNTGNGYFGGMQFDYGSWLANGGGAYAPTANLATPAEQLLVAYHYWQQSGWSPWPNTSAMCGL